MRNLRLVHPDVWPDVPPLDATVQALLRHGRTIVRLPPAVRARALARARAALAALTESTPGALRPRRRC